MAVDVAWVPPTSATLDLAAGALVGETTFDALASNLNRLGGADGNTKTGNYGIGVTPSAWNAAHTALQVGATTALSNTGLSTRLSTNTYVNSTGAAIALTAAAAARVEVGAGTLRAAIASSVAAGAAQTFFDRLVLDANGNVGIGAANNAGGGPGTLYLSVVTTAPPANPVSGGVLYVNSGGALVYRGPSGTITIIATS